MLKTSFHVHFSSLIPETKRARFAAEFGDGLSEGEVSHPSTNVVVKGRISEEDLKLPNLKAVVIPWAGLPNVTRDLCLEHRPGLPVYNLHHNGISTAETALALLFSCAREVTFADRELRQGDWSRRYADSTAPRLSGRRMLLLGYGAIGQHIATVATAMGMEVDIVRRSSQTGFYGLGDFEHLLPKADVLMIALPMTEETKGLLDAQKLGLMPKGAVVVNVARGPIIEEQALFDLLNSGHLHSAGLDVWWNYPESEGDQKQCSPGTLPWHELPNVVMSPHMGGSSVETEQLRYDALFDLLCTLKAGQEPSSRVDLEAGY
ncbi:MAG: hypothetical protein KDC26_00805 [Armatimonadetes bacterium]|nr:hypothetical protein [Armatimonadota bacterium]